MTSVLSAPFAAVNSEHCLSETLCFINGRMSFIALSGSPSKSQTLTHENVEPKFNSVSSEHWGIGLMLDSTPLVAYATPVN